MLLLLFREYFLRRIRYEFRQYRHEKDSTKVDALVQRGRQNLVVIRRQVRCDLEGEHPACVSLFSLGDHREYVHACTRNSHGTRAPAGDG